MKNKKIIIISAIIFVTAIALILIFSSTFQKIGQLAMMQLHVRQLIKKADERKFIVSGTVVDQNGKLLQGVKVKIVTQLTLGIMPGRDYTDTSKIINGNFKIEAKGGSSIRLDFFKSGYFMTRKEYIPEHSIDLKDKNITYDGNTLAARKRTIVLREIGKLAKLKSTYKRFYMNPKSKEQDIMDLIIFSKVKIKTRKDIKTPKYFYLSVKRDKNGKPEMILDKHKSSFPRQIFLNYVSNDKTDGLIPVTGANIKDMRDLPMAPEKGYTLKQIPLKGSWKQFFYYKNGNTYGKVWIRQTDFISGKVKAILLINQNNEKDPKERRNLRSIAY